MTIRILELAAKIGKSVCSTRTIRGRTPKFSRSFDYCPLIVNTIPLRLVETSGQQPLEANTNPLILGDRICCTVILEANAGIRGLTASTITARLKKVV